MRIIFPFTILNAVNVVISAVKTTKSANSILRIHHIRQRSCGGTVM